MDKAAGWTLYGPGLHPWYRTDRVFYRRTGDMLEMIISKSDAPDPKTEPHKVIDLNSEESRRIMKM